MDVLLRNSCLKKPTYAVATDTKDVVDINDFIYKMKCCRLNKTRISWKKIQLEKQF